MRRTLGPLLLLTLLTPLLAGCGDDDGASADDPAPSSASSPTSTEPVVVALLSETAAGGATADRLTAIAGPGLEAFLGQLESATLGDEVRAEVAGYTVPEGHSLGAAVVAVGCDVPPSVTVIQDGKGWTLTPAKVPSPLRECLAPVTTVAVVDVPGELATTTSEAGGR
jgi:hypothetical protein